MKHGKYILVAILLMGMASVSLAADKSDKSDKTDKSDTKSEVQKAAKDVANDLATGVDNLVKGIKEVPGAIQKAAKNIKDKKDEK